MKILVVEGDKRIASSGKASRRNRCKEIAAEEVFAAKAPLTHPSPRGERDG